MHLIKISAFHCLSGFARVNLVVALSFLAGAPLTWADPVSAQATSPYRPSSSITGISFDWSTHRRLALGSDNWPITWADDGHQYTAWGDGGGFGGTNTLSRVSLGVAKIQGPFDNYQVFNVSGGHNAAYPVNFEGKSYGIISVGGVLYMWVGPGSNTRSYDEARLVYSSDYGATWNAAEWAFVKADGLIMPTILNFGKNYAGARDDFVYHYFIELQGDPSDLGVHIPGKIHLLRVHQDAMIASKNSYEYFNGLDANGNPSWSGNINAKQPVFEDPNGVGWNLSVSYNAGLGRYILTTEHTKSNRGNLGIFDAPEPWGPWTTVTYMNQSEGAQFAHDYPGVPDTTFFWNFSNKWLSKDGKDFTLVFTGSDANDSWNTVRGSFAVTVPDATPPSAPTTDLTPPPAPTKAVSPTEVSPTSVPPEGVADSTTPSAPTSLAGSPMGATRIDLAWSAANDPESGIAGYKVYRDGEVVGTPSGASFSDTGLDEGVSYTYQVSAVNGEGLEGPKSVPMTRTTSLAGISGLTIFIIVIVVVFSTGLAAFALVLLKRRFRP